ncbi:MAG: substrate-binding domain-containing protein, partial [Gemmatimonadetes bacterium]|nr:substrate-binding domain-containing protein [Gemmatimonadota bacterium]
GAARGDTLEVRGAPIRYGLSIPAKAAQPAAGERFVAYLMSEAGRRILSREFLDVLERPIVVGSGAPSSVVP